MRAKFIAWLADLRASLRYYSQRLNIVASMGIAYIVTYPDTINNVVGFLPEQYRPVGGFVAGLATFLIVSGARLAKQEKADNAN